jgi:hypothetical protein
MEGKMAEQGRTLVGWQQERQWLVVVVELTHNP